MEDLRGGETDGVPTSSNKRKTSSWYGKTNGNMALDGTRTFVGFGFGPIQAGLFLYEAFCSGAFRRLVVAEIVPEVVSAVRQANGYFGVNIAHAHHVEHFHAGPIEIFSPAVESDRAQVIEAIADAQEISTAVPSVTNYATSDSASIRRILAEGLLQKAERDAPRAVVYAAENHNHAAEILESGVLDEISQNVREPVRSRVQFLNTVIGKMSRVVSDPDEVLDSSLIPITPDSPRAFLVESFDRILISKIKPPFQRGIQVFQEKNDLLPFEEAKLFGHNATHALAAYLGALMGTRFIADLKPIPGMLTFLRAAFVQESGEALIRKNRGVDPLFTQQGYADYADDLLQRMMNPYLRDTVERVARDPGRKLGWDDRLVGTMRVVLRAALTPRRYAFGAAAALAAIDRMALEDETRAVKLLNSSWRGAAAEEREKQQVIRMIEQGRQQLKRWLESGLPDLELFFRDDMTKS
jgi:mannitol-1-phosphate 5-dehydrogenase